MLLLLLGGVFLHRLPELEIALNLNFHLMEFWPHAGISVLVLAIAALIPITGHGLLRVLSPGKHRPFLELAYGYLPLVLGVTLAHYLKMGLTEAGQILPVSWATLGYANAALPAFAAHPAVIAFLQGSTLILSLLLTWLLTQKIGRQSLKSLWPQHLTALSIVICLWQVVVGV